jgi:hypothetical protein
MKFNEFNAKPLSMGLVAKMAHKAGSTSHGAKGSGNHGRRCGSWACMPAIPCANICSYSDHPSGNLKCALITTTGVMVTLRV